jgi:hypothetical protein
MECVRPRNLLRRQPPILNERYALHAEVWSECSHGEDMKSNRINSVVAVLSLAVVFVSFIPQSFAADGEKSLSKKEVKALIATAKTPAEHRRVASYYREQAVRLTANGREHVAMAEEYAKNPTFAAMGTKQQASFGQGASHCRRWADLYNQQAKEAEALATLHEEMAKSEEQK